MNQLFGKVVVEKTPKAMPLYTTNHLEPGSTSSAQMHADGSGMWVLSAQMAVRIQSGRRIWRVNVVLASLSLGLSSSIYTERSRFL